MARRSLRSGCIVTRIIDLTPPDRFFRTHMRRCRSRVENQGLVALFDRHDRPFVSTCPNTEHRAQRKARLARQDHRRQAAWACRSEHNAILPEVESCDHDRPCRKQTSHSARRKRRRDNSYPVGRRGGQTQLPCASARGLGEARKSGTHLLRRRVAALCGNGHAPLSARRRPTTACCKCRVNTGPSAFLIPLANS